MTAAIIAKKLNGRSLDGSGFSRVDLLAVIALSVLLAATALPSVARINGKTAIAQCAANLQQYDMALQIYANENQGDLPLVGNSSASWAWDTPVRVVSFVTNVGVNWKNLYCPGTSVRFTEQDNLNLFNYDPDPFFGFSVLGYANTIAAADLSGVFATNRSLSTFEQRTSSAQGNFPIHPATHALVADATLTMSGGSANLNVMQSYNWVDVDGGYTKHHLSPHLSGSIPLGGNIGMLDGHVEWRSFTNMLPRTSSAPYFYW